MPTIAALRDRSSSWSRVRSSTLRLSCQPPVLTALRSHQHEDFDTARLVAAKGRSKLTVCVPTRETAATIEATVSALMSLTEIGLVDRALVVDASSGDGTADLARSAGADVLDEGDLIPEAGPVRGKGDAMWRALGECDTDLICFVDGDVSDFAAHYVVGLVGPLLVDERTAFSKGFFDRPLRLGEEEHPGEGGRVTELMCRPLLEILAPELAEFRQPLAGEFAARTELLERIPFATGYAVEAAMLIDVWRLVGIEGMVEVGLGSKRNAHQSLRSLSRMAREVAEGIARRLPDARASGSLVGSMEPAPGTEWLTVDRPPLQEAAEIGGVADGRAD